MIESADLEFCGWPYVVIPEGARCTIGGQDVWKDEMGWMDDAKPVGFVSIRDVRDSIPVFLTKIDENDVRVAASEVSQGVWFFASNDVAIVAEP